MPNFFTEVVSCASKNYIGLHGMQAEKLQYHKGKKEPSRQNGNQEVLQILQEAYFT